MQFVKQLERALESHDAFELSALLDDREHIIRELSSYTPAKIDKECSQSKLPKNWKSPINLYLKSCIAKPTETRFDYLNQAIGEMIKCSQSENRVYVNIIYTFCEQLKELAQQIGPRNLEITASTINNGLKCTMKDEINFGPFNKKMAYYPFANMLMSVYFRLRVYKLANGIISATETYKGHLMPFDQYSPGDRCAYLYYFGVLRLIAQKYEQALDLLEQALKLVPESEVASQQTILFYLIPLKIKVKNLYPTKSFPWSRYELLKSMYFPLIRAMQIGNCEIFNLLLQHFYDFLIDKNLYLIWETLSINVRLRLVHKVWILSGRSNVVPIDDFRVAFELVNIVPSHEKMISTDATILFLSNHIYDNTMKAYIHHGYQKVVLKKENPFPTIKSLKS